MIRKRTLHVYCFVVLLVSCGVNKDSEKLYSKLLESFDNLEIEDINPDDIIMVINMRGCSVCYSRALYFLEENIERSERVHYIITGIQSRKNLMVRLGKDIVESNRVYIDTHDLILMSGITETYPLIFYRKNSGFDYLDIADISNTEAYSLLRAHLEL